MQGCNRPSSKDEGFQESPPIVEFSALDIRDGPVVSDPESGPEPGFELVSLPSSPTDLSARVPEGSLRDAEFASSQPTTLAPSPNRHQQDGDPPSELSSSLPSTTGPPSLLGSSTSFTPPAPPPSVSSSSGPNDPALDSFLQAIHNQETAGGADFLRAQSDVYDRVIQTFFSRECDYSRQLVESEHTHTLQERIQRLSRSLPPLSAVFGEGRDACDPRASFPQWQSFLSDQPVEPLSFRKTQASLSPNSVTITRQWDIDSIWFGAKSLSAIRAPNQFRLSFFPPHKSNICTNQVIQPHGLDLAHTRHTCIGSFTTAGVRFSVFVFFPHGARSQTRASANSLSLTRFRDLYDEIILPAVYETVPDHARQEIPSSYDLIYAKSRAYQEKPGAGRWSAEDESRSFRLAYNIPADALPHFWASIVERANLHRIQTRRGEGVAYFQNPRLLFQSHDLKNVFARPSLHESLALFRDIILANLDPSQLDMHSCWLDVGMRDHVSRPPSSSRSQDAQGSAEPWTLLWKSECCRHLHKSLQDLVPEAPLDAKYYRSFLLRDAGTYYAKARPSRVPNPGHPDARSPGIVRAKAYNCSKELFGIMFSNYQLFSSGHLPLLAFDEGMLKDLEGMDQNRQRAFVPQLNRSHLLHAWDANKRHLRAISSLRRHPNFGIRKEVTFRLDVILAMWADGALEPDRSPYTGPTSWDVPLDAGAAARLILPLDHIFQEVTRKEGEQPSSSTDPVRQILAFYTAQLFCRLLIYALDDEEEEQNFDNWIWRSGGDSVWAPILTHPACSGSLIILGIPTLILEISIGQAYRGSVVVAFHGINKHLKGLGLAVIMTGFVVATYYVPILAWKGRGIEFYMQDVIANVDPVTPESGGYIEYPGTGMIGETVGWCAFIWFTVWLCMFKGVGTTGRAVYFTMGLPVIMLIIILGRSVSLPDASKGIKYYFGGCGQIFFSIGVGFGYFTSYASYNTKYANTVQDALIIACCNSLYEITAGFAVFGVIGFLGYSPDDPSISLSTFTVGFLTYPLGLAEMPGSNVWAALFFLTLAVLGLSSAFALLESFVTLICDSGLGRKYPRTPICTAIVVIAFLLSLIYCTEFGFYLLDAVDTWTNNLCLIFVVWCEAVSATTLYQFKDVVGQVGVTGYAVYSAGYILSMVLGVAIGQAEGPEAGAGTGFGIFVLTNIVAAIVSKTPDSGAPRFWGKNRWLTKLWWLSFYSGNQLRRDLNVVIATGKNWSIPWLWPIVLRYVSAPILSIVVSFAYPAFTKKSNDPLHVFAFTVAHCVMLLIACGFVVPRWFDVFVPPEKMHHSKTFYAPHVALAPLEMRQSEVMEEENSEVEENRDSGEKGKGGIRQDADIPER
ncbi:hypothetical protein MRS44_018834 [Fusarium solani]|uniref:uncharacterized protein n=1 Tax=Fusarium solani TaxID=169388 RepID=UPI0032C3F0F5|nr:hypothetical protein MRS44_018834 [Fusarium solani]